MQASSNWLSLKKSLSGGSTLYSNEKRRKRRKVDLSSAGRSEVSGAGVEPETISSPVQAHVVEDSDTLASLRRMVNGYDNYPPAHVLPGKYIAIDCEMVGIAGDPSKSSLRNRHQEEESSLARVSVVNYYGVVQLDVFVQQKERVTNWRTPVSGVRERDMVHARQFSEVQKLVADLLKDRILVGHAVHNDLKALLLSHPHNMIRDTQVLARRHGTLSLPRRSTSSADDSAAVKKVNKRPALRMLVSQVLGIDIQTGEHSSVIDARAAMAVYRLHRKTWDKGHIGPAKKSRRTQSSIENERSATGSGPQDSIPSSISVKRRKRSLAEDL